MMKNVEGYKLLYPNNHSGSFQIACVSEMSDRDFLFMLERLQNPKFQDYIFPQSTGLVECRIMLKKVHDDCYVLDLNLGLINLSRMSKIEFDELVKDLSLLQTRQIGSKVYFPEANHNLYDTY